MSLLELVVAMSVLAIVMTSLAATMGVGMTLTRNNRNRSIAANLAAQEMDTVRSATFTSLAPATTTVSVGGVPFTVNRELTWVSQSASAGPCDANGGTPQVLRVHVWVDWPDRRGVQPAMSDTEMSPPVGTYDPNTGHLAVKVLDRNAADEYGVVVNITGPQTRSLTTNSQGCAFFAFLTAGSYTVSLNTTGWVDRQGNQNPSQTANVVVGQTTSSQFDYDQRSRIRFTLVGANGGVVPADAPITLGNTILVPLGQRTYTSVVNPRTINNLFPTDDGYTAWAGSCADADPEGHAIDGSAYYPGAVREDPVAVTPGVLTTTNLTLTPLSVHVVNAGGTPVAGRSIVAVHAADQMCATGESHVLGTTDGNGDIDLELPYGTWTLQEQGQSPSGAWPVVTLSPLDTLPRDVVTVTGVG